MCRAGFLISRETFPVTSSSRISHVNDTTLLMAFAKSTGLNWLPSKKSAPASVAGGGFGGFLPAQPGQGTSPFRVTVRACLLSHCNSSEFYILRWSLYSVLCVASPTWWSSIWPSESTAFSFACSTVCTSIYPFCCRGEPICSAFDVG